VERNGSDGQAYKKVKGAHWIAASVARFCPTIPDFLAHQPRVFDRHTQQAELARVVIRRKRTLVEDDAGASPWHIFAYSGRSRSNA
jgi:hypothetical protein